MTDDDRTIIAMLAATIAAGLVRNTDIDPTKQVHLGIADLNDLKIAKRSVSIARAILEQVENLP
jgi:hypothetical protein